MGWYLEVGSLGGVRSWGQSPQEWDWYPYKRDPRVLPCLFQPWEIIARRQPSMNQEVGSHQTQNLLAPWPQISSLQHYKNKCLLFKSPRLWYFVIAAWMDKDNLYLYYTCDFLYLKISIVFGTPIAASINVIDLLNKLTKKVSEHGLTWQVQWRLASLIPNFLLGHRGRLHLPMSLAVGSGPHDCILVNGI